MRDIAVSSSSCSESCAIARSISHGQVLAGRYIRQVLSAEQTQKKASDGEAFPPLFRGRASLYSDEPAYSTPDMSGIGEQVMEVTFIE